VDQVTDLDDNQALRDAAGSNIHPDRFERLDEHLGMPADVPDDCNT
jgi:hypothetical protein